LGCVYQPVDCDDGNACTNDWCDPQSGCMHEDVDCEDGNECTDCRCEPDVGCICEENGACDD
jgi:hypothetical protein